MSTQKCEICGGPYIDDIINILSIRKPNGSYNTMACTNCAKESGVYCEKHEFPHMGFDDGTTCCDECATEKAKKEGKEIFTLLLQEAEKSKHKAAISKAVKIYKKYCDVMAASPLEENVGKLIAVYNLRKHQKIEDTIKEICKKGPQLVFPEVFLEKP